MKSFFLLIFLLLSSSVFADHYVLVAGINNEQVHDYFTSFEVYLRSKDIQNISRIKPSSLNTVIQNANSLKRQLLELARDHRPLVIVAHSKGGLEVANTLALNPSDFPPGIVRLVIYANTPFQGSPYMAESVREFEAQYGQWGNQYNPVYLNALNVLKSLTTEVISSDLEMSHRNLSSSERKSLSDRSYFLRTQKEETRVSIILKKSAAFLRGSGPNDGLIPVTNQMRADFGQDLGIMNGVDHTDLFVRKWGPGSHEETELNLILKNVLTPVKTFDSLIR